MVRFALNDSWNLWICYPVRIDSDPELPCGSTTLAWSTICWRCLTTTQLSCLTLRRRPSASDTLPQSSDRPEFGSPEFGGDEEGYEFDAADRIVHSLMSIATRTWWMPVAWTPPQILALSPPRPCHRGRFRIHHGGEKGSLGSGLTAPLCGDKIKRPG